jgi:L-alanine-DL-glutamate epimerase-like enolase superfamily enzyme
VRQPTVERMDIALHRVPLPHEIADATQRITSFEYVTVRVISGGVEGLGWAYTTGSGGEAVASLVDGDLAGCMLGREVTPLSAWRRGKKALTRGGYGQHAALALSAVDIALWDAHAKRINQPLFAALGGKARRCPTYGSGVDLGDSTEELTERIKRALGDGYSAIKIKLGADRVRDRERLAAAREAIGETGELFADANQAWSVYDALNRADDLVQYRVGFLEEPLPASDIEGYRKLAADCPVPLAGGETLNEAQAFAPFISGALWQVMQPDICRLGGITEWLRVARAAELWNIPLTTHYTAEIATHLASCSDAVRYVEITDHNLVHLGITEGGANFGAGWAEPTPAPGHGLELQFSPSQCARRVTRVAR